MKKKYIFTIILLVFAVTPIAVHAQQDQTDPKRLEREKRISQRVSRVKPDLSDEQKRNYKLRCKGAQTKVSKHLDNAKRFSDNHDKKFDTFLDKTSSLVDKLETEGKDVATAQTVIEKAANANVAVKTAYESYVLALTDTAEIDCQIDPAGFRASIDEAKQKFRDLRTARQDLRKLIKVDLKTALQSILGNS